MQESKTTTTDAAKQHKTVLPFQKRRQLEQDLAHVTSEMYKRNFELAETNKILSLLRLIDSLALESQASLTEVCQGIASAVAQSMNHTFVGLFTRTVNSRRMTLNGSALQVNDPAGKSLDLGQAVILPTTLPWFSATDTEAFIPLHKYTNREIAALLGCSKEFVVSCKKQLPLQAVYAIKLVARGRLVGVLIVGYGEPMKSVSENDKHLLARLSEGIGLALDSKLLFEENQHVLQQLQTSNAKLKALDEAKNDFISMASHQMRTPLTSVKGYISMVLEGDAGAVNETQKQMLGQALYSSQRMVYLIADLLNVSRLKTGKFIIEPTNINLADIIEDELRQLKETAAVRSLELVFKKPKRFPSLMLDETKTRQVIMNFVDNAIYYTQAGGQITVRLVNKPNSIELHVEDNGIGVPKSEQQHLFTKFYRAGNARKARPDGTGLGLFMAKKVVIAQGGSILFRSTEGKGSDFGFMFSKQKP